MNDADDSPARLALQAARAQHFEAAAAIIARLIDSEFGLKTRSVDVGRDGYSLNSVNGLATGADGAEYFFKFHHEEGEEVTLQELYRGELLRDAGYPVDLPEHVSKQVGRQLLLYRRRHDRRFVDLCAELDFLPAASARAALRAQADLDELTGRIYGETWHRIDAAESCAEPLHQLFHHRLVDPGAPDVLGGRAKRFFWDRGFDVAGLRLGAPELRATHWRIDGVDYRDSIEVLLERSLRLLRPAELARFGGVTAHGDAHNANVWFEEHGGAPPRLVLFDPAFAGVHVPALLAEVKATFHNIFAHPLWLYAPAKAAERYRVQARLAGDRIELESDWRLPPLRVEFLQGKATRIWRPLMRRLAAEGALPDDWREILRCALFCCPALVMDLCAGGAGGHNPVSSALGLGMAVRCGSPPAAGQSDVVSEFLDSLL